MNKKIISALIFLLIPLSAYALLINDSGLNRSGSLGSGSALFAYRAVSSPGFAPYHNPSPNTALYNSLKNFKRSNPPHNNINAPDTHKPPVCVFPPTHDDPPIVPAPVPEPSTMLLVGSGMVGVATLRRFYLR